MKYKRIIVEMILLISVAAVIFAVLCILKSHFVNISGVALDNNGSLAVIDKTSTHTIFYMFDEDGNILRKYSKKKQDSAYGVMTAYKNPQVLNGQLYFQEETYSETGVLSGCGISALTPWGTIPIYADSERTVIGNLSVHNGKLYFITGPKSAVMLNEVLTSNMITAGYTLMSYNEQTGCERVLNIFGTGETLIYAGQNSLLSWETGAGVSLIDAADGSLTPYYPRAVVDSFAADGNVFAFFDLHAGSFVTSDGGEYRPPDKVVCGGFDMKNLRIAAVTLDKYHFGSGIILLNLNGGVSQWTRFHPQFMSAQGVTGYLSDLPLYILLYVLARVFLFLLIELRIPVMLRITLMMLPFMAAGILISTTAYKYVFFTQLTADAPRQLVGLTDGLDIERIEAALKRCTAFTKTDSAEYRELTELLKAPDKFYCDAFIIDNGRLYSMGFDDAPMGSDISYIYTQADYENLKEAVTNKKISQFDGTPDNPFQSYRIPILNSNGDVYAVLEVGVDLKPRRYMAESLAQKQIATIIIIITVVLIVFLGVTRVVLRSVKTIHDGVERITDGATDVRITVNSKDELGAIAAAFNKMSAYIDEKLREGESYHRFVPEEISILLKRTVVSAQRGDHVTLTLPLLCFCMPKFYETGNSSEHKDRMMEVFDDIAGILRQKNGYTKDMDVTGTFCVFMNTARQALNALLAIRRTFGNNRTKLALDYGEATIAVMGEHTRLQTGILSNMTICLRELLKYSEMFNADILVSGAAFGALESPGDFNYRFLGGVDIKGQVVLLYDFFDGDGDELYKRKLSSLADFNEGVALYQKNELIKSRNAFIRVLRVFPDDGVSKRYLRLCESGGRMWLT